VIKADRYDSGFNRTYAEMAEHYGTAILPARGRKPKDKAKVEVAVQVAQRWIVVSQTRLGVVSQTRLSVAERIEHACHARLGGRPCRPVCDARSPELAAIAH
jgi:transposase